MTLPAGDGPIVVTFPFVTTASGDRVTATAPARHTPVPYVRLTNPEWARDAAIYQIHLWHMTPEGTLRAAAEHLPRLADLGVGVIQLTPIHEIGEENRKGTWGSPYAIRDHRSLEPRLGTLADLRHFVRRAHDLGLHVILDWVGNHTSWDAPLLAEHPEWYARDHAGNLRPPLWFDWDDVISLDYSSRDLRVYMADTMAYWLREADVDGYRCDAAGLVPVDFWETVRAELEVIKPVFLLAEWESRELHAGSFDATYSTWPEVTSRVAQGAVDVGALRMFYAWDAGFYPREAMRLMCVSNHDMNHELTEDERYGHAVDAAIVLSVVGAGIPLVFTGQEAGNAKRLSFFEPDQVEWRDHPRGALYRRLLHLKRETTALWNGRWGAPMLEVRCDAPSAVLSFVRQDARGRVLAVLNFSPEAQDVALDGALLGGAWTDAFTGEHLEFTSGASAGSGSSTHQAPRFALPAGGYRVLVGH